MPNYLWLDIMNFEKMYPNRIYLSQEGFMLKGKELSPCVNCSWLTRWIEINFESYFCSTECVKQKWNEYIQACRTLPVLPNLPLSTI